MFRENLFQTFQKIVFYLFYLQLAFLTDHSVTQVVQFRSVAVTHSVSHSGTRGKGSCGAQKISVELRIHWRWLYLKKN